MFCNLQPLDWYQWPPVQHNYTTCIQWHIFVTSRKCIRSRTGLKSLFTISFDSILMHLGLRGWISDPQRWRGPVDPCPLVQWCFVLLMVLPAVETRGELHELEAFPCWWRSISVTFFSSSLENAVAVRSAQVIIHNSTRYEIHEIHEAHMLSHTWCSTFPRTCSAQPEV